MMYLLPDWWASSLCPGMSCWEEGRQDFLTDQPWSTSGTRGTFSSVFSNANRVDLLQWVSWLSILPDPGPLLPSIFLIYSDFIFWLPLAGEEQLGGAEMYTRHTDFSECSFPQELLCLWCLRLLEILCTMFLYHYGLNAFWKLTWETNHHFIIFVRQWICNSKYETYK